MKAPGRPGEAVGGGEQFPPLPGDTPAPAPAAPKSARGGTTAEAMDRLAERAAAVAISNSEVGGFEASVHKIKEQVLPRLLERVDP